MKLIAKSKRLYLRELNTDDAIHFYNLNSDLEVLKYTGNQPFKNIEEAKGFLDDYLNQYEKFKMGRWAVCLNKTDTMLGWCGLKYRPKENLVDVGYRLFKNHWNNGYATEATQLALEYGFNNINLKKIVAHIHEENTASHKVALKAGLIFTKNIFYDNKPARLYSVTKTEYFNKLRD